MTEQRTIYITPAWTGVMPGYLHVLENGTEEGKRLAREALMELAEKVDAANKRSSMQRRTDMQKYRIRADYVRQDYGRCYFTVEASSEQEAIEIAHKSEPDFDWAWDIDHSETISIDNHDVVDMPEGDD